MDVLKFVKIRDVKSPSRAHFNDAGIDFFIPNSYNGGKSYTVMPGESIMIDSGIKVNIPRNHALIFFNKSGVAAKKNLVLGACCVDYGYQGEIIFNLHNIGLDEVEIMPGEKITQGIILPINYTKVEEVDSIENLYSEGISDRGEGGFGSTGVK